MDEINAVRAKSGLAPLAPDPAFAPYAAASDAYMVAHDVNHGYSGPLPAGYSYIGEVQSLPPNTTTNWKGGWAIYGGQTACTAAVALIDAMSMAGDIHEALIKQAQPGNVVVACAVTTDMSATYLNLVLGVIYLTCDFAHH
jgi:hypothetical protein